MLLAHISIMNIFYLNYILQLKCSHWPFESGWLKFQLVCVDNSPTSCIQQIFAKFQSSLWEQIDNSYWIEIFFPFPKGRVGQAEQSNLNPALFLYNWLFDLKTQQKTKNTAKTEPYFSPLILKIYFWGNEQNLLTTKKYKDGQISKPCPNPLILKSEDI